MSSTAPSPLDLVIVGAGPSGLAVAIAAHQAGLRYEVLEKGVLVNSIFNFPRHMTFFTTSDLLEIGGLPFVTPYEKPTQAEGLKYYRRVSESYGLQLSLGEAVTGLRCEDGLFAVESLRAGEAVGRRARNVALATGYYDHPNRLGIPGEELPHVFHYYDEAHPFWRQEVVVVGGKNSAAIAALELHRAGARVRLVHRGATLSDSIKYWIRPDIENRIKEGSVIAHYQTTVQAIRPGSASLQGPAGPFEVAAQAVFLLTGYHPDTALLEQAGVTVDPASLIPDHKPDTLETNVPGLYLAGALVSGRLTSRIFIENGRFHGETIVRSIVAAGRRA